MLRLLRGAPTARAVAAAADVHDDLRGCAECRMLRTTSCRWARLFQVGMTIENMQSAARLAAISTMSYCSGAHRRLGRQRDRLADELRQAGQVLALLVEQHLHHGGGGDDAEPLVELARPRRISRRMS